MLRNEETMIAICETVASGVLVLSKAARINGVATRTLWTWLEESKRGEDERYLISFPTAEKRPFHVAIARARRMAAIDIRSEFEARALRGHDELVHFQGQVVWRMDPRAVGLDPDLRELLGFDRDGLLRDERGNAIPVTQHIQPPVSAVLKVLAAHFPKEYGDHIEQNINLRGGVTLGVQAVGLPSRAEGVPPIPPPPPRPVIDVTPAPAALPVPEEIVDAEFNERDTTDTAPMADEDFAAAPLPEPAKPETVIKEPAPEKYQPSTTSDNALVRDLVTRLRSPPETRSANPIGSVKATKPLSSPND
ncbi:hypothetical protein ACVSQB_32970 [Bradyrhizobium elkanii]